MVCDTVYYFRVCDILRIERGCALTSIPKSFVQLNERVGRLEHDNNDTTKEANDREEEKGLLSSKHDTDPSHSTTKTVEE